MAPRPTSLIRAEEYLRRQLANRSRDTGPRLPSIGAMAGQCNVSSVTMAKAVRHLADAGLLHVARRPGVYAQNPAGASAVVTPTQPVTPPKAETSRAYRWQEIMLDIKQGTVSGRFPPGTIIPPAKELRRLYGCTHRTMVQALTALAQGGTLRAHGRGFRVFQRAAATANATLVVLVPRRDAPRLATFTPRAEEIWRHLERQCLNRRIRLMLHSPTAAESPGDQQALEHSLLDLQKRHTVIGYMLFTITYHSHPLVPVLHGLRATGKPAAIIQEVGTAPMPQLDDLAAILPPARVYSIDRSDIAGRLVGDYLLSQGHRHIACFPLVDPLVDHWCVVRTAGMRRAYEEAGLADGVRVFGLRGFSSTNDINVIMERTEPFRAFVRETIRLEGRDYRLDEDGGASFIQHPFFNRVWGLYLRQLLRPLFEAALADRRITAWVGINDGVALVAQHFLRGAGVDVPGRISVAGFDDSTEAISNGLTSYNFNMTAIVDSALDHILANPRRPTSPSVAEIPGVVMQRQTTGPAPALDEAGR